MNRRSGNMAIRKYWDGDSWASANRVRAEIRMEEGAGKRKTMHNAVTKRIYDLVFSGAGLFLLFPFLLAIAIAVKLFDGGPIFFRQWRVGLHGKLFRIWKFRTMVIRAESMGPGVTKDGDNRITRIGRYLRKTKLDELPQLWNVLKGEMSLVGPRPEVPRYVERFNRKQRRILALKPGITDLATLAFRNEEELLKSADDIEHFYMHFCVPKKIHLNLRYAQEANVWQDTKIIMRTLFARWLKEPSVLTLVENSNKNN